MKWFGKSWGAPICKAVEHVLTPVGCPCGWCEEPILQGEDGFIYDGLSAEGDLIQIVYHFECNMRLTIGSVLHQLHACSCYIPGAASDADPPELTRRQAARLALELWEKNQRI